MPSHAPFSIPIRSRSDKSNDVQAYSPPSPNEMVVDTPDYDGFDDMSEKEPIAIISPDPADMDTDRLQDLPLATDCMCDNLET
jgi:hypothetical protein